LKRILFIVAVLLILAGCIKIQKIELTSNSSISVNKILNITNINNPIVISHRGASKDNPEHSFAGYNQAIAEGTKFIEQDLRISADNILYVNHDLNLLRTTGINLDISKSTSNQIEKVKLPNGENIHPLSEIFEYYKKNIFYVIETKYEAKINYNMENKLIELIKTYDLQDFVIVQSFSLESLMYIHEQNPEIQLMLLLKAQNQEELTAIIKNTPKYIKIICFDLSTVNYTLVNLVKKTSRIPMAYTIENQEDLKKIIKYRLEGIFTDDTKGSIKLLQKNMGYLALPDPIL